MNRNPRSFASALRRAARSLERRPAFFFIAVSSLAVALGLATAVIAEIDSLRHPYVPVRDAGQVYSVMVFQGGRGSTRWRDDVRPLLANAPVFAEMARLQYTDGYADAGAFIGRTGAELAGPNFFTLLGVSPRMGRVFEPNETLESRVALVSDSFWRRYFGNRSTLDGVHLVFSGETYRVIGVLPQGFEVNASFVFPAPSNSGAMPGTTFYVRAKPGIDSGQVRQALATVRSELTRRYATATSNFHAYVRSLTPNPLALRTIDVALVGAAVFILIIACANVSALMLARGVSSRRDYALRLALGAGRLDLLRDITAEVSILTVVGGVAGLLIALAATGALRVAMPPEMAWHGFVEPRWNLRVFVGLFGAMVMAIVIAAAAPAWFVTRIAPAEPLKDGSATTTGRPTRRFQLLVVAELALSLILLIGASLVARTVARVATFDFGYAARSVIHVTTPIRAMQTLRVFAPHDSANPRRFGIVEMNATDLVAIVDRLKAQPGVRDAAWVADDDAEKDAVSSDEMQVVDTILFHPRVYNVGPGFMATLGLPILMGRDFVNGDRDTSGAAILDEASAHRLFPAGDAVGRMVKLGPPLSKTAPWIRVIGIARNAVHELPEFPELAPPMVIYVSRLKGQFNPSFVVRAERGRHDVANTAVKTVRESLPFPAGVESRSWASGYVDALTTRQFVGEVCATLSIASLILATAGLFGVLSYVVNQRMREFAVRIAVGAGRNDILRLVARDGFVMALGGTAVGGIIGLAAGFSVYDWLWGIYPVDAIALVSAEAVLLVATAVAMVVPALRGARANPVEVMRSI